MLSINVKRIGDKTMSSEILLKTHEENKTYLRTLDLDCLRGSNVRIIDRRGENLLLEYNKVIGNRRYSYRYIRVKDSSTDKHVFLSVPNNMSNCKTAIAWTFGLSVREYDLFFET